MINNKRELGGIKNVHGNTIKHGYFFRSAGLIDAQQEELEGISLIIDLRTTREREEAVDKVYGVRYLPMPVFDKMTPGVSHEKETERRVLPSMKTMYGGMVRDCKDSFASILRVIMNHDYSKGGVLFHCSGGKDRTGLVAAFILEMLEVDRGTIMDDYLKTNEVMLPEAERVRPIITEKHGKEFADSIYQAMVADREYLENAWDNMDEDYFHQLGITDEEIEEFRKLALE